jgi:hypothetical protein
VQKRLTWLSVRALRAFCCLTFLLVQGGLEPRHTCPVHDGTPAASAQAETSGHGHHQQADSGDDSGSCCTCLGSCMGSGPIARPVEARALSWIGSTHEVRAQVVRTDAQLSPQPRLLPFATAPPLS